jgi:hypothetical protein
MSKIDSSKPGLFSFGRNKEIEKGALAAVDLLQEQVNSLSHGKKGRKKNAEQIKRINGEINKLRNEARLAARRSFLGMGVGAGVAAVGAGMAGLLSIFGEDLAEAAKPGRVQHVSKRVDTGESDIEVTDQLIERVERAFKAFGERVLPLIERDADPRMKPFLTASFEVMDLNQNNPEKNYPRMQRNFVGPDGGLDDTYKNGSYYWFNYSVESRGNGYAAAYRPTSKTMEVMEDFDEESLFDLLVLFHELKHVVSDAAARMKFQSKEDLMAYVDFHHGSPSNIILNEEVDAYAYDIELFNLMVGGELKAAAQERRPVDMTKMADVAKDQVDLKKLMMIVEWSQIYYPGGVEDFHQGKSDAFAKLIVEGMSKNAPEKRFLVRLEDGRLVRYR